MLRWHYYTEPAFVVPHEYSIDHVITISQGVIGGKGVTIKVSDQFAAERIGSLSFDQISKSVRHWEVLPDSSRLCNGVTANRDAALA